jgi:CDP-diglyceride synthetase
MMRPFGVLLISFVLGSLISYPLSVSYSAEEEEFQRLVTRLEATLGPKEAYPLPPPPIPDMVFGYLVVTAATLAPWGVYSALAPRRRLDTLVLACVAGFPFACVVYVAISEGRWEPSGLALVLKLVVSAALGSVAGYSIGTFVGSRLRSLRDPAKPVPKHMDPGLLTGG